MSAGQAPSVPWSLAKSARDQGTFGAEEAAPRQANGPDGPSELRSDRDRQPRTRRARGPVFTDRDGQALRWIAEQYAARLDTLTVLLGRLTPIEGRAPEPLSRNTVRNHVTRWTRLGWVAAFSNLAGRWVTPTPLGLRLAGVDFPEWTPAISRLGHVHVAGVVRLWAEATYPDLEWISERYLWRQWDTERAAARAAGHELPDWHVPDALLVERGAADDRGRLDPAAPRQLVEIELRQKADSRVEGALYNRMPGNVVGIQYFTPPELTEVIVAQLGRARTRLRTRRLPDDVRAAPVPEVPGVRLEGGW
jgi:hypothetical protein